VPEGETVEVGKPIAVVSEDGAAATASAAPAAPAPAPAAPEPAAEDGAEAPPAAPPAEPAPSPAPVEQPAPAAAAPAPAPASAPPAGEPSPAPAGSGDGRVLSPIVRRFMAEQGLDPSDVQGTGVAGRITRSDVERAIQARGPAPAPASAGTRAPSPAAAAAPSTGPARPGEREQRVPLSNIRARTGEHMVRSKATSPHAVTAVEVDYERVERVRTAHKDRFRAEEGFSLTYLPFIARAVIDALEEFPHLNATLAEGDLVVHNFVNLSIAVDLDFEGLLAPVVRDADQKRLRAIAREVHDLAARARSKQLSADDIVGGTFTITNAGSYGTHFVLPIINQPQVAILSTDGISRKPVVVASPDGAEAIAIHSVGILAMSWDHRAFDGAYAAAFLARVRDIIETRDWEAEL
jgi:pyruvate dehydrogenase E2 component (dihydrolipoamide acetyltransferase)